MKKITITMTNDDLFGGSNAEIGFKLEDIISQSFNWWHNQLGEHDSLRLDRWRVESIEVIEIPPADG